MRCVETLDSSDGIAADSVGLVFTSPPYATALDYPRAHFLAVAWMEAALGMTLKDYLAQGSRYVGSERGKFGAGGFVLAPAFAERKMCRDVLTSLASSAARQALLYNVIFPTWQRSSRKWFGYTRLADMRWWSFVLRTSGKFACRRTMSS